MEMIGVEDILLQTSIVSDLLQAASYKTNLVGVERLHDIFIRSTSLFKNAEPYISSDRVKLIFEKLVILASNLLKVFKMIKFVKFSWL